MTDESPADAKPPHTHTAYALKRDGKRQSRWLEIGCARLDSDRSVHVFLDRTPVGGFNGYVHLVPRGTTPPVPEDQPDRPSD